MRRVLFSSRGLLTESCQLCDLCVRTVGRSAAAAEHVMPHARCMTNTALSERRSTATPVPETTFSLVPVIDEALARLGERQIMPVREVVDLLLDVRLIAAAQDLVASG